VIFFLIQIPFTIAAVLGGYLFILRKVKKTKDDNADHGRFDTGAILSALGPIGLLIIISPAGIGPIPLIGVEGTLANLIAMVIGLIAALIAAFAGHGPAFRLLYKC